jgi:hypothetical protein
MAERLPDVGADADAVSRIESGIFVRCEGRDGTLVVTWFATVDA